MREILFRGKAINRDKREYRTSYKNGDWVYGLITRLYDERFELLPAEMTNTDGVNGIDVDYKTIGQFIGLTDKSGKKIFEGDICRLTNRNKTIVFIVRYGMFKPTLLYAYAEECGQDLKNPIIGTYAESLTNVGEQMVLTDYSPQLMEVIGNIHDNPELLKGGAE